MAGIAIDRLWRKLSYLDQNGPKSTSADLAEAALDAWSIVDASHRLRDLVENLPGLANYPWKRLFHDRMSDALDLRDRWQHQVGGQAPMTVNTRGQAWGSLAWMQHDGPHPTGRWYHAVISTEFKGSQWIIGGPADAIPREDTRRIRLLHDDKTFYLARAVRDIFDMIGNLETVIAAGELRLVGDAVNQRRNRDTITFMVMQVVIAMAGNSTPTVRTLGPHNDVASSHTPRRDSQ
jgi:hypothetical protein